MIDEAKAAQSRFPSGAPGLCFGGAGDYSLPFMYDKYPTELIAAWNKESPDLQLRMATLGEYLDAIMPGIAIGAVQDSDSDQRVGDLWLVVVLGESAGDEAVVSPGRARPAGG